MNIPSTEIERYGIIIIQSLKESEKQTGEILYKDILQYKPMYNNKVYSHLYNVNSKKKFFDVIKQIEKDMKEGEVFVLHFETHGGEIGIGLSSGEVVDWKDFYNAIRPINIKMGHLLFLGMSMCLSIAMISYINPEERAPYRAFICTKRKMYPTELLKAFEAFYSSFDNLLDIARAGESIQNEVIDVKGKSPFIILTAESVYDYTFNELRSISTVAEDMLTNFRIAVTAQTKEWAESEVRLILKTIHDKYIDYYNFCDIYKNNRLT